MNLPTIKLVHTIVWVFFVSLILHILYAGITNAISWITWTAVALIFLEGLVLAVNGGACPLTTLAERRAEPTSHNFDIYLPEWLAKHNVVIFTSLFVAGLGLVLYRVLSKGI